MSTLYYLSGFNNYFNRQVKMPTSTLVSDYNDYIVLQALDVNFNPNDDVITGVTVNYRNVLRPENNISDDVELDYCLVSDDNVRVSSKWFIIDRKRELGGQFTCSLRRDLFSDYYNAILKSPCYIQKATVPTTNNLILNSENMLFNQIKTAEYSLKDATETPWLCIYFNRNQAEQQTITARADVIENSELSFSLEDMRDLVNTTILGNQLDAPIISFDASWYEYVFGVGQKEVGYYSYSANTQFSDYSYTSGEDIKSMFLQSAAHPDVIKETSSSFAAAITTTIENDAKSYIYTVNNTTNQSQLVETLKSLRGKTIKDDDSNTYYTADISVAYENITFTVPVNSGLYNTLKSAILDLPYINESTTNTVNTIKVNCLVEKATVTNVQVVEGIEISMKIPTSASRTSLTDAPWDMLAIPYNEVWVRTSSTLLTRSLPNVARAIGQAAMASMGTFVSDVQLLPYCPCMEYVNGGTLNVSNLYKDVNFSEILSPEEQDPVGWGIWCNQSSFTVNITNSQPITNPQDPIEFKVNNECDMYRLVSPNYSGAFEFSATANGGITGFEANCTYKPFQPYIHINPVFGRLYGRDFNDNRGLICGGNFSMPSTQDAWTEYQIQNKSYKESFDRQIQNMETVYDIQREQQVAASVVQGITGVIGGAGAGAMVGGMTGSVPGMAIGAAVGATASLAANIYGATKDLEYADRLFEENKSYAQDQFNLSLQNIQALPTTISNVGAFDINYKYFPFLEYYTCTNEEKEALREKIKYSGMTVNAIGTIENYIGSTVDEQFIQGQLIRLVDTDADYHIAAEIASEINKGVYI